jgi:hypothetical protein
VDHHSLQWSCEMNLLQQLTRTIMCVKCLGGKRSLSVVQYFQNVSTPREKLQTALKCMHCGTKIETSCLDWNVLSFLTVTPCKCWDCTVPHIKSFPLSSTSFPICYLFYQSMLYNFSYWNNHEITPEIKNKCNLLISKYVQFMKLMCLI